MCERVTVQKCISCITKANSLAHESPFCVNAKVRISEKDRLKLVILNIHRFFNGANTEHLRRNLQRIKQTTGGE